MSDGSSPTDWTDAAARAVLRDIFDAAVASADPGVTVLRHLPDKPKGRCVVIGAGKASVSWRASPVRAVSKGFPSKRPLLCCRAARRPSRLAGGQAGRGGRNTEFLLGFAITMAGEPDVFALAGDSDGIDGTEDAAGAIVTPDTLARARAANLDPRSYLAAHDSYSFFAGIGDLVRTGPTGTNVNDIRAVLITRGGRQAE